jgi:transcriptional regulator GlxA family with amidase domain
MQKLNVGIMIFEEVEVLDFAGPFEVFSRTRLEAGPMSRRTDDSAPFRVSTVAATPDEVRATGDLRITPHYAFGNAPPIDLLVVPGGIGTRALLDDPQVIDWIVKTAATARHVTSVCTGSLLLAKANLLHNRSATTHWSAFDLLAEMDSTITVRRDRRVVDDGIVSSGGVSAGIDMAFYMVEQICGRQVADETAHYIEYPRATV